MSVSLGQGMGTRPGIGLLFLLCRFLGIRFWLSGLSFVSCPRDCHSPNSYIIMQPNIHNTIQPYIHIQLMQAEQQHPTNNFFDSHTHLLDYPPPQLPSIIDNANNNGVRNIVINTTTSKQFQPLLTLLAKYNQNANTGGNKQEQDSEKVGDNVWKRGMMLGGFGVHPCFVGEQSAIEGDWFGRLRQVLEMKEEYSVGQIGLDFRKDILQTNPKQLQLDYFKKQLSLSLSLSRPATIHCVRAHGQLLKHLKDLNKTKPPSKPHLIMHSYGGSQEITKSMLKLQNLNIFFSLSLKRSTSLCSVIPIDRLLCETDSPCQNCVAVLKGEDMMGLGQYWKGVVEEYRGKVGEEELEKYIEKMDTNQPANIVANVRGLSKFYNMDFAKFSQILFRNSLRAFKLIK